MKTILVCGGRDFKDKDKLNTYLDALVWDRGWILEPDQYGNFVANVHLIHGGAHGADLLADGWAVSNWCAITEYKANWGAHGKGAGPIRNQKMLDEGKPDLVVAFKGGKGTADMVKRARKAGVEVIVVE